MNARIPVTEEMRDLVRDYANGIGVTYDEALAYVFGTCLNLKPHDGTKAMIEGRGQKEKAERWLKDNGRKLK